MKFVCNRNLICEALSNVSKAVSNKSTMAALEGALIKAEKGQVSFYGYNLELLISTKIDANIEEEGMAVINTKIINDLIRKMVSENIEIIVSDKNIVTIKGGITECNMSCYDKNEYPELPNTKGDFICEIDEETLKNMIDKTIFCVSQNDQKPIHTGLLFEFFENTMSLVGVDGFRISIRKEKIKHEMSCKFTVPQKTMHEISRLIKESEEIVKISKRLKTVIFEFKNYVIVSRLLEGEFLDYQKIINKPSSLECIVDTKDFLESVERVSLIINERNKTPIIIHFTDEGKIKFSCASQIGNIYDEIACKQKIDNFKIGFNNKYIIDAFKACEEDEVKIKMESPLFPIKILPVLGESYIYLILPVRLKDE